MIFSENFSEQCNSSLCFLATLMNYNLPFYSGIRKMSYDHDFCLFLSFGLVKGQKGKKAQIFAYKILHKIALLV